MPTVLVVDDSASDRLLIQGLLAGDSIWSTQVVDSAAEALGGIKVSAPDVIVTDLVMPEMDGLELVAEVRRRHPHIPVILLTGQGSEELAEKALREGAASYLSKSNLHEQLMPTIEDVYSLRRTRPHRDTLARAMTKAEFEFNIDSDLEFVPRLLDVVLPTMHAMAIFDQSTRTNVAGALAEAVFNAILHGNWELSGEQALEARNAHRDADACDIVEERRADPKFGERRVFVDVVLSQAGIDFLVRDQGQGFDPRLHFEQGSSGRGLLLMRTHMDEVTFNDVGNEVRLRKGVS